MGFISQLIGRIPILVIGVGLILLTGRFRWNQGSFETMPLIGIALVGVGILLVGGLKLADLGG